MGMSDLNLWIGEGRLTRDCGSNERDFGYIQNGGDGMAVATVSIAVNRNRKKNGEYVEEVSYFDVKIYGKTAEGLKPYLTKGQLIRVEGMLKQDRWQDKNTGNNMSKVYINATSVRLIGGKREDNQNGYQQSRAPQFTPANNGYQNQQFNGYTPNTVTAGNVPPQNNQQNGFSGATANGNYESYGSDFPEDIPF